jgi:RNA polymerase sigma-70 factor (ECF subfamily)
MSCLFISDSTHVAAGDLVEAESSPNVTELLLAWSNGNRNALDDLMPLVHEELLVLARRFMSRENPGHTLQSNALVNEAYLRLVDARRVEWRDRAHFLAVAARIMRHILVDFARSKRFQKRAGWGSKVSFDNAPQLGVSPAYDVLGLDEAIGSLSAIDRRRGEVVELRLFGGLTIEETAAALQVSSDTVTRDWKLAKAWLARELASQSRTDTEQ